MITGPIRNFRRSLELNEKLHSMIPGGSHTYSKGEDQFPFLGPRVMARAAGAHCWDVDNNQYIDWAMGNRVIILGHAYPAVNEAVVQAINQGCNFSRPGILEAEVAEMLLELLPKAEMVKFGKNGSDVTTAAIKLSRAATGRKYVAQCADHPFFSTNDWFIGTTAMNAGVPDEIAQLTLPFRYNDIGSLQALYDKYPGQIAAVILEPVKNDEPRDNFLQKLRELTTREGSVLIFDEMIAGMRFDIRGAHYRHGVFPDLATYGKAVANGFSFSFLAGRRDIMELGGLRHRKRRAFLLSQTHASETTGLAACRATMRECQRLDTTAHVWRLGKRLVDGFRERARAEGVADHVRIIGFDCNPQIVCTQGDGRYWPELSMVFHEEVISHGVLIPWITITQSHGEAELARTLDAVQRGMKRARWALDAGTVATAFQGDPPKPVFRAYNYPEAAK